MALITLAGIDEAIANLNINPDTLKGHLVLLIRSHFNSEESLQEIAVISADDLVQELWETTDAAEIRQKKKNLSSLKSSLNKSLKKLTKQDKNPEGLVVSRDNVFTVSDEHKNDLLQKMGITTGQDPVELISTIRDLLGELMSREEHKKAAASLLEELDKTREIIADMAGLGDKDGAKGVDDDATASSGGGEGKKWSEDEGGSGTDGELGLDDTEKLEIIEEKALDDDTEIIDEDELDDIIEVDEEELAGGGEKQQGLDAGADGGTEERLGLGDEELEVIEEEALDDEIEIIDENELDDIIEVEEEKLAGDDEEQEGLDAAGDGEGESSAAAPMDLSHYIEPDEALAAQPDTLAESHEDYINQILKRFMPKFIKIPAGHYPIGNLPAKPNERPAAHITLDSFHISQLPVTNDLFDFFVRETGYETDAEKNNFGTVTQPRMYSRTDPNTGRDILTIRQGTGSQKITGANWKHPSGPESSIENKANHPVVQISRRDALAFATWAGKRLSSEDEWEAAARGIKGFIFPWGNEWNVTLGNFEKSQIGDTCPVTRHGQESISPFGLYDMLGNVFEWTATVHQPGRQTASPIYILKGGCWASKNIITAATRLLERDTWSNIIGFRCAV